MEIKRYIRELPPSAMEIRVTVFVDEQGFYDEFDDIDAISTHFVMFDDDGSPIATCRVFEKDVPGEYYLGRLAVMKAHRGQGRGAQIVAEAENYLREIGALSLALHSQCSAEGFYLRCGYTPFGDIEDEQGCPHIWMKKVL